MDIKTNISRQDFWLRALFMIIYGVILYFVLTIAALVIILQCLVSLITAEHNSNLIRLSEILIEYITDILNYLFFLKSDKPFPFGDSVTDMEKHKASSISKDSEESNDQQP